MAQVPARSAAANSATEPASAFTVPRPVTTTRCVLSATTLLGRDELGERVDRGEGLLADLFIGNGDAEALLDEDDQLQGIDRVEPEALDEDRLVVGDAVGSHLLEAQTGDQQLFEATFQIVGVRRHVITSPP